MSVKHFLDLSEVSSDDLRSIIDHAREMKAARRGWPKGKIEPGTPLDGRVLAMIFEKPSTRTRVSFDIAMRQMGGKSLVLSHQDMQLGRGETIADTARVLSSYVDVVMLRANAHESLIELAREATIPVINGLTDKSHPCQIMADILTYEEQKGPIKGAEIAWVGDGNNVAVSFVHAAAKFGFSLRVACPAELALPEDILRAAKGAGADILHTHDPIEAVTQADCIVTDTWVSMGDADARERHELLVPFQVNRALMSHAKQDAIFMHCLPAHREEEVTTDVIDGPASVVFAEAENRLHAQKAILAWCLA